MSALVGRLRRRLLGIPDKELAYERRGFRGTNPAMRTRLERIGLALGRRDDIGVGIDEQPAPAAGAVIWKLGGVVSYVYGSASTLSGNPSPSLSTAFLMESAAWYGEPTE